MVTLKDIAAMCDVSPSTVSNILNGKSNMTEETKKKVLDMVEKTGYRPNFFAQGMRRQNNKCICIIAEELLQFSTPPIVEAIMNISESKGYRTILINMSMYEKWKKIGANLGDENILKEQTSPALLEAQTMRADGVIYVAAHGHVINIIPEDYGIPVIFAYGPSMYGEFKSVLIDDEGGAELVVEHLIAAGHKEIGLISGKADNLHAVERLKGYKKALRAHGIKVDESLILFGDWERESGRECAKKLIKKGVKTIWCMNDLMAAGAYDAIREAGLSIGKDISVFGFDNREISGFMYPGLSTCELPLKAIGEKCADLMIKEIEKGGTGKKIQQTFNMPCKLILRDSVTGE